jgi:hypothetical protein
MKAPPQAGACIEVFKYVFFVQGRCSARGGLIRPQAVKLLSVVQTRLSGAGALDKLYFISIVIPGKILKSLPSFFGYFF